MRYWIGFVLVLLAVVGLPLRATAQESDKGRLEEFYPGTLPESPEEFDRERVEDFIEAPPTSSSAAQDAVDPRVRRARNGLIGMSLVTVVGGVIIAAGAGYEEDPDEGVDLQRPVAMTTGGFIAAAGVVGMITCGTLLGVRKKKLRELQEAQYETPPRSQWDLAQSRLAF